MTTADNTNAINILWKVVSTALVFWMHAGFCLLEAGSIRHKNVTNILFKNVLNVLLTTFCWWFWGYAFAFGKTNSGFIGGADSALDGYAGVGITTAGHFNTWLFQWAFAATSLTIVSGGMAERANSKGYLILILGFNLITYPVVCHWVWGPGGWLGGRSFQDFAGSGVVHTVGGIASLVGCAMLGPRRGKLDGHSMPLIVLGTFILWMGWFGFNGGSGDIASAADQIQVGRTLMTTTISGSVGGIGVIFFQKLLTGKFLVGEMCNGILAGLVAITAPCNNVTDWAAFCIGLVAVFCYVGASKLLLKLGIDDAIGAFPVHGACGIWGVLATGLFDMSKGGFYNTSSNIFGVQCYGILAIIGWTALTTGVFLTIAKLLGVLRVSEEVEDNGLDNFYHNQEAAEFGGESEKIAAFKNVITDTCSNTARRLSK